MLVGCDMSRGSLYEKDGESQEFDLARFRDLLRLFHIACRKPSKPRSVFEGARGTKSAAALWQMKADEVPMRHRVQ